MSVYICEDCYRIISCNMENIAPCPFEPCLSIRCFDLAVKFNDIVFVTCDDCFDKYQAAKKRREMVLSVRFFVSRSSLVRRVLALEDSMLVCESIVGRGMELPADIFQAETKFESIRDIQRFHEQRTKSILRGNISRKLFWQRR